MLEVASTKKNTTNREFCLCPFLLIPSSRSVSHQDTLLAAAFLSPPSAQAPLGFLTEPLPSLTLSCHLPPPYQHPFLQHSAGTLGPLRILVVTGLGHQHGTGRGAHQEGMLLSGGHTAILFWKLQASRALDIRCRGKRGLGGACLGGWGGLAGISGRRSPVPGSPGKA